MTSTGPLAPPPHSPPGTTVDRRKIVGAVIAAVVVVAAVLLLLARCGGDDTDARSSPQVGPTPSASPSAPAVGSQTSGGSAATSTASGGSSAPTVSATGSATGSAGSTAAGDASLTVGGTALLPAASSTALADLRTYAGKTATASGAVVQSVPVDNGFWIGTSDTDRVYVELLGAGDITPHPIRPGDRVDFTGTVKDNSTPLVVGADLTADDPEGAAKLATQGGRIAVDKDSVSFAS